LGILYSAPGIKYRRTGFNMKSMSYKDSGVDIDTADQTKKEMKRSLETSNPLVLNRLGAFASLVEVPLKDFAEPVLAGSPVLE